MLPNRSSSKISPEVGSPAVTSLQGMWTITKLNMTGPGIVAVVDTAKLANSQWSVRFRLMDGTYVEIQWPQCEFDRLQLKQNEYVILASQEPSSSGNASTKPARVSSIADQQSDCTQCFPTGP